MSEKVTEMRLRVDDLQSSSYKKLKKILYKFPPTLRKFEINCVVKEEKSSGVFRLSCHHPLNLLNQPQSRPQNKRNPRNLSSPKNLLDQPQSRPRNQRNPKIQKSPKSRSLLQLRLQNQSQCQLFQLGFAVVNITKDIQGDPVLKDAEEPYHRHLVTKDIQGDPVLKDAEEPYHRHLLTKDIQGDPVLKDAEEPYHRHLVTKDIQGDLVLRDTEDPYHLHLVTIITVMDTTGDVTSADAINTQRLEPFGLLNHATHQPGIIIYIFTVFQRRTSVQ